MKVNEIRNYFNTEFDKLLNEVELREINEKLENERIDVTLPSIKRPIGSANILERVIEEVEELLMSMLIFI